ncbi:MAG: kelch motif-containing protein [Desulfobulbaceae bacterium]|nr:kelch motif-containing protein [Desulfobulbaceae bacterium]
MRNFLKQHGKLLACLLFFLFFALLNGAAHAAGWFPAQALDTERSYHTAILLGDGRVLVAGGYNSSAGALNSAELYDPSTDTWSAATDNLTVARYHHTATMLPDGRILVTG